MSLTLKLRQRNFIQAIFSGSNGDLPSERMAIYRDNVIGGLLNALEITYPKVIKIIGYNCFVEIAQPFCYQALPTVGCLDLWGGDFPEYLTTQSIIHDFPFLYDLAQLEWHKSQIFLIPTQPALGQETLKKIIDHGWENWAIRLHPTVFFQASAYDLRRVLDYVDCETTNLSAPFNKSTYFVVLCHQNKIHLYWLSYDTFIFLKALGEGKSALESLDAVPTLNLAETLSFAFSSGLIVDIWKA